MRLKHLISLYLIFLFSTWNVCAQVNKAAQLYYHISEKDGLADNAVNCFFQDSRGIMWMGTKHGINSFNGSEIGTWRMDKLGSANSLFNNEIEGITEDANHVLWIATLSGLSSLDPVTKKMHSWQSKGSNDFKSVVCDGDSLWIASGGGLQSFNIRRKTFTLYTNNAPDKLSMLKLFNNNVNTIFLDSKKRLWLGTVNGLWLFDIAKKTYEQYDGPLNDPAYDRMVNIVFEDHKGQVWIGTWSGGIKKINPRNRTVQNFNGVPDLPMHVMSIVEQKKDAGKYTMWLSEYLTEFEETNGTAKPNDIKPVAEAATLNPNCLYISKDNLLWIATVKGVYIFDPARQLFKHYFLSKQEHITNQSPALYDTGGKLWIGGYKNFTLKLLDSNFNVVKDYSPAINALNGGKEVTILSIVPHASDLWLASTIGVLNLNVTTGKVSIFSGGVTDGVRQTQFINNVILHNREIWCFPWRRGLWKYDAIAGQFKPLIVVLPDGNKQPKALNLQDAVADRFGQIWFSDMDYGLVKYNPATGKAERIVNGEITPYSKVVEIKYFRNRIWLIANTTILSLDPATNKILSWPLPEGMNKDVYDYVADKNDNLWIATRAGLVVFNTASHTFSRYTEEDGLINNDMGGSMRRLANGRIIYSAENYITCFNPGELLRVPTKKKLLLTEVNTPDSALLNNKAKKIIVPPGSEKITFKWALINYTNPLLNRYYNKLDGIDNGWNYAGNKGMVEYNSLPPGDYIFRYKAVTADGLSGDEKQIKFTVQPHFWQAWWFLTIIGLVVFICVLLIIRYVRVREQRRSAIKLQLSALEMKALRAQMNPHFIFNALNSIQECIVTKNTDTAYSYLSSFSKLVRMILENSEKQFITLEDEIETLRLYLSIEKLRFDDTFEYKIDIDCHVETSFMRIPAMIIQPFVENALWHGLIHKSGDKKLSISFEQENNSLICKVKDNGVGRGHMAGIQTETAVKKRSMGVKITEERLQLLETDASININDLQDKKGEAIGTEVTIIIPLEY